MPTTYYILVQHNEALNDHYVKILGLFRRLEEARKYREELYEQYKIEHTEIKKYFAIDEVAQQATDYDEKLSKCHSFGLCADKSHSFDEFDKHISENCEVCPRKSK